MKKILLLSLFALSLSACSLPFLNNQKAALQVTSTETASVYLNNNYVGQTPYFDDTLKPGEYTIRLLVENNPSKDWQVRSKLSAQIVTVVHRDFGESADLSSSYVLQLEPIADETGSEISIITIPDNVIVKLDGQSQGFSPTLVSNLVEGDHVINLAAPGYQEQSIKAQTKNGYKLIVSSQLAKNPGIDAPVLETSPSPEASSSASADESEDDTSDDVDDEPAATPTVKPTKGTSPTPAPSKAAEKPDKPYVVITETGTGWLRVRSEPTTSGEELAKVDVGASFPYLEANDTGWYKIEYETGEEGWIAGTYADLFE